MKLFVGLLVSKVLVTLLYNAPPAKSFCCIYVTYIHSFSATAVYQDPKLRLIVMA